MAAMEIDEYIKNGNIKNSVNMPNVFMERGGKSRICMFHKNIPGMLSNIMPVFSKEKINVDNMINKSKGDYAYSMFDIDSEVTDISLEELRNIEGVIKVRYLKYLKNYLNQII